MRRLRPAPEESERGVALVLAIAFMVVIGAIGVAVLSFVISGVQGRGLLDTTRNTEYAAESGINYAITQVRQISGQGPALAACSATTHGTSVGYYTHTLNGVTINVDCYNAPTLTRSGYLQRDVIFVACANANATPTCSGNGVIRAEINFEAAAPSSPSITRTWVQSWSVNG